MDGYSGRGADTYRTSAEHVVYMLALTADRKLKEPDDQMITVKGRPVSDQKG